MAATSLFLTRDALHGLLFTALGGVGVELLPAPPSEAEDLSLGVACWWSNDVSVSAEPYTLPSGLLEQYTHTLVVQSIPEDGDVSVSAAQAEAMEIVDLVYYHEKSVEEVAQIVGIPENTVKTRLFYARKKLAELLKAAGIERGWP